MDITEKPPPSFQHSGAFTRLSKLDKLPSCTGPNLTNRKIALHMGEKATPSPSTTLPGPDNLVFPNVEFYRTRAVIVTHGLPQCIAGLQDLRPIQHNEHKVLQACKVLLSSSIDVEMKLRNNNLCEKETYLSMI